MSANKRISKVLALLIPHRRAWHLVRACDDAGQAGNYSASNRPGANARRGTAGRHS